MMRSAGKVSLAVLFSRILGLIRDQVFVFCFGGGRLNDAFLMAFRIPNLLRDLFAEGALSSAFVTVFARTKARDGDAGAWTLARLTMTLQCLVLGIIVILGILFAPQIVKLVAPGFAPDKMELTVIMTRILFPFILFVGAAALAMGVLNAYGRFGLPASASSFFNLGSIVLGLGLAYTFDPHFGTTAMICMSVGTLGGGVLQWLVQVPALRKLGYRYRPEWDLKNPGLREIGRLMGPAVIGVSAVQINVVVNSTFASELGDGPVTWLSIAFRMIQLPIGMFGVAISTAALPDLAVDATLENKDLFRDRVERALRLNAALCIPSACGLALLSVPLIAVLFEHGKFDYLGTMETARVLTAYSAGLIGYASAKILAPAFYALNRNVVPMFVSLGSIIVTITLNWFFVKRLHVGPAGLALATAFTSLFGAGILLAVLSRLIGGITRDTWRSLGKVMLASAVMSAIVALSQWVYDIQEVGHYFLGNLCRLTLGIAAGSAVYLYVARRLHLDEILEMEQMLAKRLGLGEMPGPQKMTGG